MKIRPAALVATALLVACALGNVALSQSMRGRAQPRLAASRPTVVPIEFEDGRVYVPVFAASASDSQVLSTPQRRLFLGWFIFDTGASETVLDAAVARRLGLATRDAGSEGGAGAGKTHEETSLGVPLEVGTVPLVPKHVVVVPLDSMLAPSSGRHVAGIIGSQFFLEHVVEVPAPWRFLIVDPASGSPASHRATASVRIPLALDDGIPFVSGSLTLRSTASRVPLRLLLDLGAKAPLLITEQVLDRLGGPAALPPHLLASLGAGFGGETRYYFARVARVTVGSADSTRSAVDQDSIVVGFSAAATLRHTEFDGLVGTPFLSHYGIRIDYRNRELTLQSSDRSVTVGDTSDFDMSGMFVVSDFSRAVPRFFVRRVVDGSPAANSGVRAGDEIKSVGYVPARDLDLIKIRLALRRTSSTKVVLGLSRNGRTIVRTMQLREQL